MKILHVLRQPGDERALSVARAQMGEHEVSVLLLQEAAVQRSGFDGTTYVCSADVEASNSPPVGTALDYAGIVAAIFAHDRVVVW